MAFFNYPASIDKNTPAVATEVQVNFDSVLAWILDNLIQKDGTVPMTGPLVLAPGNPAAPSQAANKAYVDSVIPIGVIWEYGGTVLPANWLWCDGSTYTNTSQQKLASAIGRSFTLAAVPAGSFQVPDKRTRVSVGVDAREAAKFGLGVTGGQRNSEVLDHQHQIGPHGHGHSITASSNSVWTDHLHDFGTGTGSANHGHGFGDQSLIAYHNPNGWATVQGGNGTGLSLATFSHDGANHTHSGTTGGVQAGYPNAANHSHTISIAGGVTNSVAYLTGMGGGGTTSVDKNLPPYIAVNYIIYAGTP